MSPAAKPTGHLPVPLLIFGTVSLLLGMMAEVAGVFAGPAGWLRGLWDQQGLEVKAELGLPGVIGPVMTGVACFGLVAALLSTPGLGRRMLLGVSALVLVLGMVPALAVWGIFWNPSAMLLSVAWAWFSACVYAQTHVMPYEAVEPGEAANIIRMGKEQAAEGQANRSHGQS